MNKKWIIDSGLADDAKFLLDHVNARLDDTLGPDGFAQNLDKQKVVPNLSSRQEQRRLYGLSETVVYTARRLGSQYSFNLSHTDERLLRVREANIGWRQVGNVGSNTIIPLRLVLTILVAKVQSRLLSAMTSSLTSQPDYYTFDVCMLEKLRYIRRCRNPNLPSHASIFNFKLWCCGHIFPPYYSLLIQRLRWSQVWVKHPDSHSHTSLLQFSGKWVRNRIHQLMIRAG